jgi:hypothetical protein
MPSFQAPRVTSADALERLKELGPWFYEFDRGEYGRTESELPVEVRPADAYEQHRRGQRFVSIAYK